MSIPVEEASCILCGQSGGARAEARGRDYEYETTDEVFTFVRCRQCGHCYLNPRPTIAAAPIIYPDTYYSRAGDHSGSGAPWLGRIKDIVTTRRIRPLLNQLPPRAAVLDVGAGDGALLLAVRQHRPDLRLIALDWSFTPDQAVRLRERGIEMIEGPIEQAALPDHAIDLVIMNQVIEHLWDAPGALRKVRRAMRSGGRLSIATPNLHGYDRRLFGDLWGGYYFPRHLNLFSSATLPRLLAAAGFTVTDTRQLAAPLIWIRNFQYLCKARRSRWHRFFTDHNLPALFAFALLDEVMTAVRFETSNLQCIARAPENRWPD